MKHVVTINVGQFPEEIFCPICRKSAMEEITCEHVLFAYNNMASPLENDILANKFSELICGVDDIDHHIDPVSNEVAFDLLYLPDSAFLLAINSCGMACGPVSSTDFICFDLNP